MMQLHHMQHDDYVLGVVVDKWSPNATHDHVMICDDDVMIILLLFSQDKSEDGTKFCPDRDSRDKICPDFGHAGTKSVPGFVFCPEVYRL